MLRFEVGQAYLWCDPDSLTLIDTGPAGSAAAIADAIRDLGFTTGDVHRVVLTHFHDDHVGSAAEIGTWGEVGIVAHAQDAPIIRGDRPGPAINFVDDAERTLHERVARGLAPAPPARVDQELHDGDVLEFGGGAQVVGTPGHTDGSIGVYLPAAEVLFTGDTVASIGGQAILGPFNLDRVRAITSFRRLVELDASVACFGHGDPVVGDASTTLRTAAVRLVA